MLRRKSIKHPLCFLFVICFMLFALNNVQESVPRDIIRPTAVEEKLTVETNCQCAHNLWNQNLNATQNYSIFPSGKLNEKFIPELPHVLWFFPMQKLYPIDIEHSLSMSEQQRLRLKTVRDYCNSKFHLYDYKGKESHRQQFSIFEKHGVSECRLPKTGTSFRAKVLWKLHHDQPGYVHPIYDKLVKKTHAEGYRKRYQNRVNFTYMFVRDPFERAVSSYFNKVLTGQILKNKSMTMENYFHYLNTANSNNEHFVTQLSLCNPCLSKFSFIGRSESLNSDFRFIVNEATDFHKLVSFRGNEEKFNDAKKEMDKYRTLTLESLFQFIWKFRHDYLAFGYNPHDAIKQITLLQKNFS